MHTFAEAEEFLSKGRDKDQRTVSGKRGTDVRRIDADTIALRYHATDVVTYHRDGTVTIFTGGWHTQTTKERINDYSNANIAQDKGLWYFYPPLGTWDGDHWGGMTWEQRHDQRVLYFEHALLNEDGTFVEPPAIDRNEQAERAKKRIDSMVKGYIKGFYAHLVEQKRIEAPSAGDCFYCVMKEVGTDKPLGDVTGNVSHLLLHLQERYYVPSLLYNAIVERGYVSPAVILTFAQNDLEQGRGDGYHIVNNLRAYFRKRKLALTEALLNEQEQEAA